MVHPKNVALVMNAILLLVCLEILEKAIIRNGDAIILKIQGNFMNGHFPDKGERENEQSVQFLGSRTSSPSENPPSNLSQDCLLWPFIVKDTEHCLNLFGEGVAVCSGGTTAGK